MWLMVVVVLILGLGILALIGLVALAKEFFSDSSVEAHFSGGATGRHCVGSRTSARRSVTR
jgi:hypothetical protein